MTSHELDLELPGLAVTSFAVMPTRAVVAVSATSPSAVCPRCGAASSRVHSRYVRTVRDLACHGRAVALRLTVRRFRCPNPACPRSLFTERLPGLVGPRARATARLAQAHRLVGLALGGEAGSRLAGRLAIPASPDTVLRRVKGAADEAAPPPRFVGIDDWAWRKGHRYGTIVVDLERGRVIDLLPDREAETVRAWLAAHPGIEVISRDRWPAYARAASEGAPRAKQVADRWHLLKNLREAVERIFERHARAIAQALRLAAEPAAPTAGLNGPPPDGPVPPSAREAARVAKRQRRAERYERVRELHRQGLSGRLIARTTGLSRGAVRRYLASDSCPDWRPGRAVKTALDAHRGWLDGRVREGCRNAAALHRELAGRGYEGGYDSVRRLLAKRLAAAGVRRQRANAGKPQAPPAPSPRQLSFDWARRREDRAPDQQARVDAIRACCAELAAALDLSDGFADLVRKRPAGTLGEWLARAEASGCAELRNFAAGVRRDEAAVSAAVTEGWSNGPVESQVGRLKLLKRQMYGRAGLRLLRARVLYAA